MIKMIDKRGTGKTYRLCQYAIENNCDILVVSEHSIDHVLCLLRDIAEELGCAIIDIRKCSNRAVFMYNDKAHDDYVIYIMTPSSITLSRPPERKLVVDEVERVLAYMIAPYGYSYDGYTVSKE